MTLLKDKTYVAILLVLMVVVSATYIMHISIMMSLLVDKLNSDKDIHITVIQYNIAPEVKEIAANPSETKAVAITPEPEVVPEKVTPKVEPVVAEKPKVVAKVEPTVNDDAYLLAQIIDAEAKGEPYNGKVAVGNVVMNRVNNPNYPDTVKGVVFQKGQFQPVRNGSIHNKPSEDSLKAAEEVMNGKQIVGKHALYFYNPDISTSEWIFSRKTIMDIGSHRFAY